MRIGVDLGGTKIEAIALDQGGAVLARLRIPAPRGDYRATLDACVSLITACEAETGRHGSIGIGTPGAISPFTGRMRNANSVWLNGQSLDRDLAERLGRPVRIANDADCSPSPRPPTGPAAGRTASSGSSSAPGPAAAW